MVALYVNGEKVSTLADLDTLLPRFIAEQAAVEFREDAGEPGGASGATQEPICPWELDVTPEEWDRRFRQSGVPLSTILKRLGV